MNFDLHLYGETPEELLNVLAHLGHMDSNYHTPIPDEHHPAQAPTQQPQSEPVTQSDKPKAQTPAKQKKAAQKPAAVPAEEPANPTNAPAQSAGAAATTTAPAAPELSAAAIQTTPAAANGSIDEPGKDPASENEIRTLVMELMKRGKRAECQKIITSTGAKGISSLPPSSYTDVWQRLNKLKDGVDANASH